MLLKKDVWLSKQIGFNAYNLKKNQRLNFGKLEKKILITLKVKKTQKKILKKKIQKNFKFIDVNYKFVKKIKDKNFLNNQNYFCRLSNLNDKQKIVSIAKEAFRYSRFQIDKRIPKILFERIQLEWINNFFKGKRGTDLIVAKKNKRIAGFLLILVKRNKMYIDLIATSPKFQRTGVAKSMINFAVKNINFRNFEIEVGTQKKNHNSIIFYKKIGFKKKSETAIYHYLKLN